jgi:hypothetical protein
LSRQNSLLNFFKPSSGTRACPSVFLVSEDDDLDDPPAVQEFFLLKLSFFVILYFCRFFISMNISINKFITNKLRWFFKYKALQQVSAIVGSHLQRKSVLMDIRRLEYCRVLRTTYHVTSGGYSVDNLVLISYCKNCKRCYKNRKY